jgi:hypothetical protein
MRKPSLGRAARAAFSFLVRFFAIAIATSILMAVALTQARCAPSSAAANPSDVKGCSVSFLSSEGRPKPFYEPFLKVADKESLAEDGSPEIWGFKIWDQGEPDENGKVYPVNIREDRFIPHGKVVTINGQICRCPDYW